MTHCKALSLAALAATFAFAVPAAQAGQCPAGQTGIDTRKPGAQAHKDVTDKVIGSIDLVNEAPALKDHKFRLRRLVVQPGGEVACHSHAERPSINHIRAGTIPEYSTTCP